MNWLAQAEAAVDMETIVADGRLERSSAAPSEVVAAAAVEVSEIVVLMRAAEPTVLEAMVAVLVEPVPRMEAVQEARRMEPVMVAQVLLPQPGIRGSIKQEEAVLIR